MKDEKELLKEKAVLLLSRERELFALKTLAKRLKLWLQVAQQLPEFVHGTADRREALSRVSRALVATLQFQKVLFFELDTRGLAPVDVDGGQRQAPASATVSPTEMEDFLKAHPHGVCNTPDAETRALADAVGLHRFLWCFLNLSQTGNLLLVAGYDAAKAKFYRGFSADDQGHFHHMGAQLELLLANQQLVHNLAAEKQRLAEFNQELEARVLERTEMLTSANTLLENTLGELRDRNQRIAEDLQEAQRFQRNALPVLPQARRFDFAVEFVPLDEVGGDIYDVCELAPDHYRLFIADAPGHGVQAAMRTLLLKAEYDRLKLMGMQLPQLFDRFNRRLLELFSGGEMLCTACITDIHTDGEHATVSYVNAAHSPILHFSGGKSHEIYQASPFLGLGGGEWSDPVSFRLGAGDQLLLITDGLTEQLNETHEMFEPHLAGVAADSRGSAAETVSAVMEAFTRHHGRVKLADDLTVLCVRFDG